MEDAPRIPVVLPPFFAVTLWKLAVMSFFTLGLYDLYWFYRNWQRIRVREQKNISPAIRVFFAPVFCYFCFRRIRQYGLALGLRPAPPILVLALLWVAAKLSAEIPDSVILFALFGFVFLLPVQAYANRINSAECPLHDRNARFSVANLVWILIGASLLLLHLVTSLLLPHQTPAV
jgi:hypothetical protein